MDRHRHTGMEAHFSGTSSTILADTQHALILNYVDTKPCSARESLPYRQEQHPRLSSRRTFVGDYPRYRDLSTPTSTRPPLERGQEAVSSVSLSFPDLRFSIPPTVLPRIVPLVPAFSVALVDPLVDGKKRIHASLFSKDWQCLRFLPLRVCQNRFRLRKCFTELI